MQNSRDIKAGDVFLAMAENRLKCLCLALKATDGRIHAQVVNGMYPIIFDATTGLSVDALPTGVMPGGIGIVFAGPFPEDIELRARNLYRALSMPDSEYRDGRDKFSALGGDQMMTDAKSYVSAQMGASSTPESDDA